MSTIDIINLVAAAALVCVGVVGTVALIRRRFRDDAEMARDFQRRFGDHACLPCMMARCQARETGRFSLPPAHRCPEQAERDYRGRA